jgi:transposase-like protein
MQEMGLIARVTKVTYRAPGLRRSLASGENHRSGGAFPVAKDKVWVADVTYLKVKKQWHYLSVISDHGSLFTADRWLEPGYQKNDGSYPKNVTDSDKKTSAGRRADAPYGSRR